MNKSEFFKFAMEKSNSDKVIILTNHYQILGTVYDCEVCNNDCYINLTDVSLCKFDDNYIHTCDEYEKNHYDWLNINLEKVVAFSFV